MGKQTRYAGPGFKSRKTVKSLSLYRIGVASWLTIWHVWRMATDGFAPSTC